MVVRETAVLIVAGLTLDPWAKGEVKCYLCCK
jgi:hypothetical protein